MVKKSLTHTLFQSKAELPFEAALLDIGHSYVQTLFDMGRVAASWLGGCDALRRPCEETRRPRHELSY